MISLLLMTLPSSKGGYSPVKFIGAFEPWAADAGGPEGNGGAAEPVLPCPVNIGLEGERSIIFCFSNFCNNLTPDLMHPQAAYSSF